MQLILDNFLGIETKVIPKAFWDEISVFDDIIISISGGVDSSAVAIAFYIQGLNFELLWNNTLRSMKESRETIIQLMKTLKKPIYILYSPYDQKWITKRTKKKVEEIVAGKIAYNKRNIPCCYYLKEAPVIQFAKKQTDHNILFISSIAGYESMQRQIRLGELRNKNTFLRFKVREQRWFAYPLRDYTNRKQRVILQNFLAFNGFSKVRASSCYTCPILYLFEKYIIEQDKQSKDRIERSKKVYAPRKE